MEFYPDFKKWIEEEGSKVVHQVSKYRFHCPDHRGPVTYCFCMQQKNDNFISCDSC